MKVIVCLDDKNGMLFNNRRQSKDQAVQEELQRICQGGVLWMNQYSFLLYGELKGVEVKCDPEFLRKAGEGEYALVETENLEPAAERIRELLVFRWNRIYPADHILDLELKGWKKSVEKEFPGKSHEKITLETYLPE